MEYLFIYLLQFSIFIRCVAILILIVGFCSFLEFMESQGKVFNAKLDEAQFPYDCKGDGNSADKKYGNIIDLTKKLSIICLSVSIFLFLLPTKQTLLLMGGTYIGKKAVNQVITSDKLNKVNTIIELELDKRIKKLKGGN